MQIEQIDRDAAKPILRHLNNKGICNSPAEAEAIAAAFAAHRVSARPDDSAVERVARWLARFKGDDQYEWDWYIVEAREVVAIAALGGE